MAKSRSGPRGKSGNTGGLRRRHGWAGGKHPKNRLYVGPRQAKK